MPAHPLLAGIYVQTEEDVVNRLVGQQQVTTPRTPTPVPWSTRLMEGVSFKFLPNSKDIVLCWLKFDHIQQYNS